METNKKKGIRAGLIYFFALSVFWFVWALFYSFAGVRQLTFNFFIGIGIFAGISTLLGISIARNYKRLKRLSYALIAAIVLTGIIMFGVIK